METPSLRIRLVFEDRSILSKPQRSDGMNRSWLLIKPQQHGTISDVCAHLLHIFKLRRSCPNGILLSMEGFVLPPLESTEILKDKEIICVRKKHGEVSTEAMDAGNMLDEVEVDEMEPVDNGLLLLENDNSDKETGEYQSESEEVEGEQSEDEASPREAVSKKRKASIEVQNSKKKKRCLGVLDDADDETETEENDNVNNRANHKSKQNKEVYKSAGTSNKKVKSPSSVKRNEQLQDNVEEVKQASTAPGAKKVPSRSARRKKAKRQWMREVAKISKKKPHPCPKHEAAKAENKEANGRPKGLLHWKQAPKKHMYKKAIQQNESNQSGNQGTEVVPAVTRPGHIRFESFDEDQAVRPIGVSNEAFRWNGGTGKKKGQRWAVEKFSTSQRNSFKRIDKEALKKLITDIEVPVIDPSDFEKLPPCCSPKEGDVIAYRLLELSSSWTPEFSSFRVGRILYYDARNIILIPVPEYPIDFDNIEADGPNESPYGEDGTLEINYSALVDVRNIKQYDSNAKKSVENGANQTPPSDDKDAAENVEPNINDNKNKSTISKDSNPGDDGVNPWEQFSKARCSKDTEASEANHSSIVDGAKSADEPSEAKSADEPKGGLSENPWSNVKKAENENIFQNGSWADIKKSGSSGNESGNGSSWGRPWSSFAALKLGSFRELRKESDGWQGSGKPWARGGRGNGRGGGRGSGRGGGGRGRGRGRGRG